MARFVTFLALMGLLLAACSSGGVQRREVSSGGIPLPPRVEVRKHQRDVFDLALSPDGSTLATVSADAVVLWNTDDMTPRAVIDSVRRLEFHEGLVVADGGERVAVLSANLELSVWEDDTLETRTVPSRFGQNPRELIGFGADGSLFWVSVEAELVQWIARDEPTKRDSIFPVARLSYFGQASPAGRNRYLVWSAVPSLLEAAAPGQPGGAGSKARLEALSGAAVPEGKRLPRTPLLGGTARRLLVLEGGDGIELYDIETGALHALATTQPRARQRDPLSLYALSSDGRMLALSWLGGGVELWDLDHLELVSTIFIDERYVRAVYPTKVLDLVFGEDTLWLLLPEQKLLPVRVEADGAVSVDEVLSL